MLYLLTVRKSEEKEIKMEKCSVYTFFGCWVENFLQHSEDSSKAEAIAFATWSFTQNPEMFKDMMSQGFCNCDTTCK